jgi:hypothetical protein
MALRQALAKSQAAPLPDWTGGVGMFYKRPGRAMALDRENAGFAWFFMFGTQRAYSVAVPMVSKRGVALLVSGGASPITNKRSALVLRGAFSLRTMLHVKHGQFSAKTRV